MGCRILRDIDGYDACFYDSVTMTAFGPVISVEDLEAFGEWLKVDARQFTSYELWDKYAEFKREEEAKERE